MTRIAPLFRIAALGLWLAVLSFGTPVPALAQSAPAAYLTGHRYDLAGRETGTISPDPDGAGALHYATVRYTYDSAGRLIKVETGELAAWQSESVAPANWTGFTILQTIDTNYDELNRKVTDKVSGSDGIAVSLTQYSYNALGLLECTAVRMNPAAYGSLPATACTLGTQGSNGPDRIAKNVYDATGKLIQIRKAVGTAIEQAYATYSYTNNGMQAYVVDANGNKAKFEYDGFDRQAKWIFPSTTRPTGFDPATQSTALATSGSLNTGDYEQYSYDANGNRISLRKRDGSTIAYQYDALNRVTVKTDDSTNFRTDLDSSFKRVVYNSYDVRGLLTSARFDSTSGPGGITAYDGFGRISSATDSLLSGSPALSYLYDKDGDRTKITHPDGAAFDMAYDGLDRLSQLKKGTTVLLAPSFNQRGGLAAIDRTSSSLNEAFGYDNSGRLNSLGFSFVANSSNVGWSFTRNAASQILTDARDNNLYAWLGRINANTNYTTNGLNEYSAVGASGFCYDPNGNLTDDNDFVYRYDVENRLVEMHLRSLPAGSCPSYSTGYTGTLLAKLHYDPMGRLYEALKYDDETGVLTNTARFLYDGDAMVLEYDGANAILNRYVHGSDTKADDPLVWYPGSSTADTNARNLYADPRGSIVLVMSRDGSSTNHINTYDEWGANVDTNLGRFQYTGQVWLDELGMYYYKARIYSPRLGRFMQTDPIGYKDQVNLYAYVGNDPINGTDPSGLDRTSGEFSLNIAYGVIGIDLTISGNYDNVSKEIGGGIEIGPSVGYNADVNFSTERSASSVQGDKASLTGEIKGEAHAGLSLGKDANLAAEAHGSLIKGTVSTNEPPKLSGPTGGASLTVGSKRIATDGSNQAPERYAAGIGGSLSATVKAEANVTLKSIAGALSDAFKKLKDIAKKF